MSLLGRVLRELPAQLAGLRARAHAPGQTRDEVLLAVCSIVLLCFAAGCIHQRTVVRLATVRASEPTGIARPIVRILALNTHLAPLVSRDRLLRATQLAGLAVPYDILALSEVFAGGLSSSAVREHLVAKLEEYGFTTIASENGTDRSLRLDSGLLLAVRYPIVASASHQFANCSFDDCVARKGFIVATLELSDRNEIDVLLTHLDANPGRSVRRKQLAEIATFLQERPVKRPTLIVGDFNIDGAEVLPAGAQEYLEMMKALGSPTDAALPLAAGAHAEGTYKSQRLDYVLCKDCDNTLRFCSYAVQTLRYLSRSNELLPISDHRAIEVDVLLTD